MDTTVTVHIDRTRAIEILEEKGWKIDSGTSRKGEPFSYYVMPGHKGRAEGGKFGADFLWELDEALTVALGE